MSDPYQFGHSVPDELSKKDKIRDIAGDQATQYTKDEANYRDAGQSNTTCGGCVHYTSSAFGGGVCDLVSGDISPNAVCDFWQGEEEGGLGELIQPA